MRLTSTAVGILIALLASFSVDARVYRCTGADGSIAYSQVPCPADQTSQQMRGLASGPRQDKDLCRDARDLAMLSFADMAQGVEPGAVIDDYGGVNYISSATLNVINFVAGLRYNRDLTPQRVGSLTFARCREGGFGQLAPGDLPEFEDGRRIVPGRGEEAGTAVDPDACTGYRDRIADIDRDLRAGPSPSLQAERARYRELWASECRTD